MGIATSIACAIHCALLPLILTTLPLFGVNIIHNVFFEWGMIALGFLLALILLFHGYIKHHRSLLPVLFLQLDLFFLFKTVFSSIMKFIS